MKWTKPYIPSKIYILSQIGILKNIHIYIYTAYFQSVRPHFKLIHITNYPLLMLLFNVDIYQMKVVEYII